jgi:hypothetical protein
MTEDIVKQLREAKQASRPMIQRACFETAHNGRALRFPLGRVRSMAQMAREGISHLATAAFDLWEGQA